MSRNVEFEAGKEHQSRVDAWRSPAPFVVPRRRLADPPISEEYVRDRDKRLERV